jgi:hypothetical protein
MKDVFPGYYRPTEEQFNSIWKDAIISFDTNILLNFYRYSEKSQKDWIELITSLPNQIWIPYQVGLEYQKNRLAAITQEQQKFDTIVLDIKKQRDEFSKNLDDTWRFAPDEVKSWKQQVQSLFNSIIEKVEVYKKKSS